MTRVDGSPGPVEIFQAGQRIVVANLLPDTAADSRVGVVAEWFPLAGDGLPREPLLEQTTLRETSTWGSLLATVGARDLRRLEGGRKPFDPSVVDRVDV